MTVRIGLERVLDDCPPALRGRRVGLFTNQAGVDRAMRSGAERLIERGDVRLERLFAGEHGLEGDRPAGAAVPSGKDRRTGLDVLSLYGTGARAGPDPSLLDGLDAVLVDVPDIGCRYYSRVGVTLSLLAACRERGVMAWVLDRPNPLGGRVEGQRAPAPAFASLVGAAPVPMRHGLTLGEIALLGADAAGTRDGLSVVPVEGWRRSERWPDLGRSWVPLSPNANSYEMAQVYPGTCLVEGTNLSEGRGTTLPFVQVGAPWLDGFALARTLNAAGDEGVLFRPVSFVPTQGKHRGETCRGVMLHVEPGRDVCALPPALHLLEAVLGEPETRLFPAPSAAEGGRATFDLLAGDDRLRRDLLARRPVREILDEWVREGADWPEVRASVALYPE